MEFFLPGDYIKSYNKFMLEGRYYGDISLTIMKASFGGLIRTNPWLLNFSGTQILLDFIL